MLTTLGGLFALNRAKIFILFSLIATWYIAHILPHYQPMIQNRISAQLAATREKIPSIKIDFHPNKDPRTAYNQSKLAMIIEARPIPHLVPQILHMMNVVPPDWRFLFIGSNLSVAGVGKSVATKYHQAAGKLDLMIAPQPWSIDDKEYVWRMLTDIRFYDELLPGVEWLLKFESDSILCSNSQDSLNDWLAFDWAGSPRTPNDRFAGNGGLSIRKVSAIKRILKFQERFNDTHPEDEWFGMRIINTPGLTIANAEMQQHFSVEEVYHEKPMGYHLRKGGGKLPEGVWKDQEQRRKIIDYCPEIKIILDMKLQRERCPGDNGQGELADLPSPPPPPEQKEDEKEKEDKEADEDKKKEEAEKKTEEAKQLMDEAAKKIEEAGMAAEAAAKSGDGQR